MEIQNVVTLPAVKPDPNDLHVRQATMLLQLSQEMRYFGRWETIAAINQLLRLLGWDVPDEPLTSEVIQ